MFVAISPVYHMKMETWLDIQPIRIPRPKLIASNLPGPSSGVPHGSARLNSVSDVSKGIVSSFTTGNLVTTAGSKISPS